jgi:hypothetical protein
VYSKRRDPQLMRWRLFGRFCAAEGSPSSTALMMMLL